MLSPFNISELHQVHSKGWTLSRTPLLLLLRELRPASLDPAELNCGCHDRDPIGVDVLLKLLESSPLGSATKRARLEVGSNSSSPSGCDSGETEGVDRKEEDLCLSGASEETCASDAGDDVKSLLAQWLTDIVDDPQGQLRQPGMRNVCVSFLAGDCFNHREGQFCNAGRHLALRTDPLTHPLVTGSLHGEAGMRVRLVSQEEVSRGARPGQVKGAPILGYEEGALVVGEECDLWQKACIYLTGCRRAQCRYAHASDL
jgi:hypothetical protein